MSETYIGVKNQAKTIVIPSEKHIVILSETKNSSFYIGVKNAGVHFTVVPGKPKVTSTVAGIPTG